MSQDELQNSQIAKLERVTEKNTGDIGELKTSVQVIGSQLENQGVTLGKIEQGTSQFGSDMRSAMDGMREAQAEERREERALQATESAAVREANAAWWSNAWKLAGAIVTAATMGGGGLYAAGVGQSQAPPDPPAIEATP